MANIEFTTQGIQKLLQELKPVKAAGPDNIPPQIPYKKDKVVTMQLQCSYKGLTRV